MNALRIINSTVNVKHVIASLLIGDNDGFAERASRVTNTAAADQVIGRWATLLAQRLDEARESTAKQ